MRVEDKLGERFTAIMGTARGSGAPDPEDPVPVDAAPEDSADAPAAAPAAALPLIPTLDADGNFDSWPTQDGSLSDFLDGWQQRHGEEPTWNVSCDGNTGDPARDFIEVDVFGAESSDHLESITIAADGTIT